MTDKEETDINGTQGEEISVPCSKCAGKTAHTVLASVDRHGEYEDGEFSLSWTVHDQIIRCCGCKLISFRRLSSDSEDYDHDSEGNIEYVEREQIFPSRIEGRKSFGDEIYYLPSSIRSIYEETQIALKNQTPILTGIGLRALIESVCKERSAKGRNLFEQIDDLVSQKALTPVGAQILHKIRALGNASAHETKPHSEKQLSLAMDVVEHMLRDVYILPKRVEEEFKDTA